MYSGLQSFTPIQWVTFYDNKLIYHEVNLDASLSGLGACFGNIVYVLPLLSGLMNLHIEMLNVVVSLKVDLPLAAAQLTTSTAQRLLQAFRPAIQKTYLRMLKDSCFLVATGGLHLSQVNHVILLAFMEFLMQNAMTPSNIVNYMDGLRASFILYNLDTTPFQNQQLQYFHKAAKLHIQTFPKVIINLDENILIRIMAASDTLDFPVIFKSLYLLAFFSFLRIFNILLHAITSFDPTRQPAIFLHNAASIVIKCKLCKICYSYFLVNQMILFLEFPCPMA